MSQATKRKHVARERLLGDRVVPSGRQQIVRVLGTPGNNLHEIETAQGQRFLVSMPSKYRKNIWIKRGDYLIVDPIEEGEKVKAEISFVLCKDHVRSLQKDGLWPEAFSAAAGKSDNRNREADGRAPAGPRSADSEDDSDLFVNTNRVQYEESEDSQDDDDNDEEDAAT
ncbi:probable RNA-binding protein EIF1AD [Tachyglossus aculeatus]|uniref:probable RNA-binding protein EIF1AD n=1 Tax=Tachyglossus aculeatus TaxID=9261 RepID=UPI0018F62B7C|nr:probable RNA-binding protein EIF1AD [Tachyglossus aculeatus]